MRDTIDMAREAGWTSYDSQDERFKALVAFVRADERALAAPVQPETDSCGSGAGCLYKVAMIENLESEVERLKAAQPAPVQEPYGYVWFTKHMEHRFTRMKPHPEMGATDIKPIYTTPPAAQRQWVGLTDEERTEIRREHYARTLPLMDTIEAKLKEKNT